MILLQMTTLILYIKGRVRIFQSIVTRLSKMFRNILERASFAVRISRDRGESSYSL